MTACFTKCIPLTVVKGGFQCGCFGGEKKGVLESEGEKGRVNMDLKLLSSFMFY